jgi:hypothetical protein
MSNEITVGAYLKVNNGNLQFGSTPSSFKADQATANGPTPGSILATTAGVTVSLAELTVPGMCQVTNLDSTNYVSFGLYIGSTFYPFGEVLPGESNVFRLARDILTANAGAAVLRVKANTANCYVNVSAFDK